MTNNINYSVSCKEAKDLLDYLKDVEIMYLETEKEISESIYKLREKLTVQHNDQIKQINKFFVGQKVKYFKGFHGYILTEIVNISDEQIFTKDGESFNLEGVKIFDARKSYNLEIS